MITFSRVGFSPDVDEAVFVEWFYCGPRCGWASLVHMRRHEGAWKLGRVEQLLIAWIRLVGL